MNSDISYAVDADGWVHWASETESGCFKETDTTGRWATYQVWVADGNTAEEWQPNMEEGN
jgi:hypothetical protein